MSESHDETYEMLFTRDRMSKSIGKASYSMHEGVHQWMEALAHPVESTDGGTYLEAQLVANAASRVSAVTGSQEVVKASVLAGVHHLAPRKVRRS